MTRFWPISWMVGMTLTGCGCQQEARQPNPHFPDSLVGSWVRVYPPPAGRDTVVIAPDGIASGSVTAVDADPIRAGSNPIVQWEIDRLDPRALCVGDGRDSWCSGYQLRGDTLALADGYNTVFLRAGSIGLQTRFGDSAAVDDRARWGDAPPALPIGRDN